VGLASVVLHAGESVGGVRAVWTHEG